MEIAPNLYCLGVGGSCPAYDKSHNLIWKGFPNEETDIDCTISKQCIASIPENSSVWIYNFIIKYRSFSLLIVHHPLLIQVKWMIKRSN